MLTAKKFIFLKTLLAWKLVNNAADERLIRELKFVFIIIVIKFSLLLNITTNESITVFK